jgi:hypothetical protein
LTDEVSTYLDSKARHVSYNVMHFPATLVLLASVPATLALVEHDEVVSFVGYATMFIRCNVRASANSV